MRVYFEAPTGALLPLSVAPESSVQETRRRISDKLKVPPEAVDLTFGGGKLQEDALLWANGICPGSTIGVCLSLKRLPEDFSECWHPASLVGSLWYSHGTSYESTTATKKCNSLLVSSDTREQIFIKATAAASTVHAAAAAGKSDISKSDVRAVLDVKKDAMNQAETVPLMTDFDSSRCVKKGDVDQGDQGETAPLATDFDGPMGHSQSRSPEQGE